MEVKQKSARETPSSTLPFYNKYKNNGSTFIVSCHWNK